jgi:hypothetical protein
MPIFNIGGFTDIHMLTEPTIWGAEGELSENNEWPAKLKYQRRSHPKSCAGRMPIGDLRAFSLTPVYFFQELSFLQLSKCLPQLLLGIHHDRTIPGNGFLERLS